MRLKKLLQKKKLKSMLNLKPKLVGLNDLISIVCKSRGGRSPFYNGWLEIGSLHRDGHGCV